MNDQFQSHPNPDDFGEHFYTSHQPLATGDDGAADADELLRLGGDEETSAREIAAQWGLPYLADDRLAIDAASVASVGIEEIHRLAAAPVRGDDGALRIVVADATNERFAAVREHFSSGVSFGIVSQSRLERLLDAARSAAAHGSSEHSAPWGQSFERVLGLVDDEAARLQTLRQKVQQLGVQMTEREQRLGQLEAELARATVDRLRDQETIDRLRRELADRDGRLDRAATKVQELTAIIGGGIG